MHSSTPHPQERRIRRVVDRPQRGGATAATLIGMDCTNDGIAAAGSAMEAELDGCRKGGREAIGKPRVVFAHRFGDGRTRSPIPSSTSTERSVTPTSLASRWTWWRLGLDRVRRARPRVRHRASRRTSCETADQSESSSSRTSTPSMAPEGMAPEAMAPEAMAPEAPVRLLWNATSRSW